MRTELANGSGIDGALGHREEEILVRARGLRKKFGGQTVLDSVDLELRRGEIVLLTGANGAGKTTLVNILTGNLEPDAGVLDLFANGSAKQFGFPRRWWQDLNPWDCFTPERVAQEGVGRAWQDIRLFNTQTLLDNIAIAPQNQVGESPSQMFLRPWKVMHDEAANKRTSEVLLNALGLGDRKQSSGDKVSLGQAKRVAIARAVQAGAKILFLDEPLSGLDAQGVDDVLHMLRGLVARERLTLLIVEHVFNSKPILDLATTVWHLDSAKLTRETPETARARMGDGAFSWLESAVTPHGIVDVVDLPGGARLTTITANADSLGEVVIEVKDLVVHRGRRLVIGETRGNMGVHGLSFSLRKGQFGILQAHNGWGKTTLLETIVGLRCPTQGSIRLNDIDVRDLPIWERIRKGISFLPAEKEGFPNLSVDESLRLGDGAEPSKIVRPMLTRRVSDLSGGEKKNVAWECTLQQPGDVLLLDEPWGGLDSHGIQVRLGQLRSLRDRAVLVAEPSPHDANCSRAN